jgi:hypothetical protein
MDSERFLIFSNLLIIYLKPFLLKTKKLSAFNRNKMSFSLNCLVLGQHTRNCFNIPFGEIYNFNGIDIEFKDLTVSNFRDDLFNRKELQGITAMNIWKVEIEFQDIKKFSTGDDIKKHVKSEMMDDNPMLNFDEYYNNEDKKPRKGYLHIFIVPIITGKCTLIFYLSNKKFALSHIFFYSIRQKEGGRFRRGT